MAGGRRREGALQSYLAGRCVDSPTSAVVTDELRDFRQVTGSRGSEIGAWGVAPFRISWRNFLKQTCPGPLCGWAGGSLPVSAHRHCCSNLYQYLVSPS